MKKFELEVGDKVRILGKSTGCSFEHAKQNNVHWKIGDIAYINYIIKGETHSEYFLHRSKTLTTAENGIFLKEDLEYINPFQKGEEMKYRFIKDFSVAMFLEDCRRRECGASPKEQKDFLRKMEYLLNAPSYIISMTKEFHDYFTQHECFVNYLLEQGYIEKVKEFEPFTIEINSLEEAKDLRDILGPLTGMRLLDIFSKLDKVCKIYEFMNKNS